MAPRALRENKNQGDDRHCEDCSCSRAADLEPSVGDRLVKQVAERRPERSGEDKGGPEQKDARRAGEVIGRRKE